MTTALSQEKPEDGPILEDELIPAFTEETGIEAKVVTAGANTYENMLRSEIAKEEPPTLFQIGSKVALERWKSYALDLTDTEWYDSLTDKSLAISDEDGVFSIPYTVEGYGIITNKRIIEDYCETEGAVIDSIDDINNFDTLKAVAEDIQAKKDDLGIEGAFASTSFSPGEEWRWTNHLFNMPLYYEYKDMGVDDSDTLKGTYMDNFKQIFDLYINNSCTEPAMLSSMTIENAMAEFALEEVAFVQNGNWAWTTIAENNEDFSADDICFLPIYIGVDGEENQGLCIGSEANLGINNQVSEEDQEATLAFIHWLFISVSINLDGFLRTIPSAKTKFPAILLPHRLWNGPTPARKPYPGLSIQSRTSPTKINSELRFWNTRREPVSGILL